MTEQEVQPQGETEIRELTLDQAFEILEQAEQGGCQVVPVTCKQDVNDTRLAILIRGEHEMASVIMAELMNKLMDLSDVAAQQRKEKVIAPEQRILTSPYA